MLFRKKVTRQCAHCEYATALDDTTMLCSKKGIVLAVKRCSKFSYDPFKRIPPRPKPLDLKQYEERDYSL